MAKALIVYATRTGETQTIGDLIAEGIRISGHEAKVVADKSIKKEADLEGYDAYVFGSATYHGEMMQSMKTLLFLAEKVNLVGKVGGAFGAYGWSGEAVKMVEERLKSLRFKLPVDSLTFRFRPTDADMEKCRVFGREIADAVLS
jgi:flavorubredoxin